MNDLSLLTSVGNALVRLEVIAAKLAAMLAKLLPSATSCLSIQQAAEAASLSPTKIRREIKSGRLPASNAGSSLRPLYRIQRSDLLAWLEENKKGGIDVPPKPLVFKRKIKSRYFGER